HRTHAGSGLLATIMLAAAIAITSFDATAQTAPAGLTPDAAAHLKQVIETGMAEPQFTPPGPAIDPASLKGKLIFTIPVSTAIPWCDVIDRQMTAFAKQLGLGFEIWQNNAQLAQWVQGFDAARNHKATLINVFCGLDPGTVAPQIKQARAAGIPVMAGHTYALGQPPLPELSGIVYGAYIDAAKLMADWVMLQTEGKADVLVITSPSTANSPFMQKAIAAEFAAYCPGCKVRYVGVNASDWPTKIEPEVRSAILADHALNYVIPIYDGMAQFTVPAIIATGASSRVKVATFNATPAVLDMIRTGDVVTFEVGEDTTWLAGAILDQDMRILLGKPLIQNYVAGVRIFTKANVAAAGVPAKFGQGYGEGALRGYQALWGVK
ncbi:MAG TPA: substrate-binding domain-containing protein, partial [Acetobacteraceae bacterium]|nr:substrate-binding domain-containing protein [Acetobacteraceae bacterium]